MKNRKMLRGVPRGNAYSLRLRETISEPYLNLLANVCAVAFADAAAGDEQSQEFLRGVFSTPALLRLQARGLVQWFQAEEESDDESPEPLNCHQN